MFLHGLVCFRELFLINTFQNHSIFPGKHKWNFDIQDIILGVYHENHDESPKCDRYDESGKNLIEEPSLWTLSIPHPEESGKCFTYKYEEL